MQLIFFFSGDDMGWLQPDRGQEGVHGRSSDHARRSRPVQHCHRLVQTFRYLISRQLTSEWTTKERLRSKSRVLWIKISCCVFLSKTKTLFTFVAFILVFKRKKNNFQRDKETCSRKTWVKTIWTVFNIEDKMLRVERKVSIRESRNLSSLFSYFWQFCLWFVCEAPFVDLFLNFCCKKTKRNSKPETKRQTVWLLFLL